MVLGDIEQKSFHLGTAFVLHGGDDGSPIGISS